MLNLKKVAVTVAFLAWAASAQADQGTVVAVDACSHSSNTRGWAMLIGGLMGASMGAAASLNGAVIGNAVTPGDHSNDCAKLTVQLENGSRVKAIGDSTFDVGDKAHVEMVGGDLHAGHL